jgi:dephospho-CoA kinase
MVLGITGGLASGKSLVTALLRARGAIVFSADEAARAVLIPGGKLLREIADAFGPEALNADGTLNRARMGQLIFADRQARERLNRLMHAPILRLLRAQIEGAKNDFPSGTVIAVEAPLLFETKMEPWFEQIVVVNASESTQIARLCARNGITEQEARRRLAAQIPLAQKAARAHLILQNDGTREALERQVEALWRMLTRNQAENSTENPA